MGTSSSYGGPKGKSPLLPDDFYDKNEPVDNPGADQDPSPVTPDDQEDPATPNDLTPKYWSDTKTLTSKYASGNTSDYKKPLSAHIKAYGGAGKASTSAKIGKTTTAKLGSFLSSLSTNGIKSTLDNYGISYQNRSVDEVLGDLVNILAPTPDTKEDAVARSAFLDAMEILYNEISQNGGNIEILNNLNTQTFSNIIKVYISSYIFQKFTKDVETRFEKNAKSPENVLEKEQIIKEYIDGVVANTINKIGIENVNFNSKTIMKQIDLIYQSCYDVIEGAL
ncbi:MAG: hypothetical protein A2Y10_15720 [Planctomycetes bacterium GWF2_41_51]|nr:MAG: hypothetical protein A2Y10_15720 [Planctomycetes bacterium GWF2_41_51]HBG27620.1 hypothetical protein [Phycisphaerales bacterium]